MSKKTVDLSRLSLGELRKLLADVEAERIALVEQQRQINRYIDLRAYEGGETPQPPAWLTDLDQVAGGDVAIGKGN